MVKLSAMMFLQFFIWGAWFEIGFSYIPGLKFAEWWMNGLVFGAFNIGALVALFFSAQFADRMFAAQKFLAVSHLVGGLAILGLFFLQTPLGTGVGELNSVTISEQGAEPTTGMGKLADGTAVVVKNAVKADAKDDLESIGADDAYPTKLEAFTNATDEERKEKKLGEDLGSATKFWILFDQGREKFDNASNEERKEKKLKDTKFVSTFVIAEKSEGKLVGDAGAPLAPFWPFFLLMLLHSVFYVPTISITNSIAFTAFTNPEKQFGPVRLWGTIGWIAASWPFIFILIDWAAVNSMQTTGTIDWLGKALGTPLGGAAGLSGKRYVFLVAGAASLVLAAFSLLLPHTPPKPAQAGDSLAWLKAMRLLKKPFVAVLFFVTFIDAAVHQSYFFWTFDFLAGPVGIPVNWAGSVMKLGQIAEILTMLSLGWVLKSFGWRATMIFGVLGHAARFAVFAFFPEQPPVVAVILLHGVCYAFFFATVYIFVDKYFPKDVRTSAQGLFNVLILGIGPFVANFACGKLLKAYSVDGKLNYPAVFEYSMAAAIIGALLLALFFHPKKSEEDLGA